MNEAQNIYMKLDLTSADAWKTLDSLASEIEQDFDSGTTTYIFEDESEIRADCDGYQLKDTFGNVTNTFSYHMNSQQGETKS